jgi:hypothetical protein
MKKIIVFIFCLTTLTLHAEKIVTYTAPAEIAQNKDFTVNVRTAGGSWMDLVEYEVLVDSHKVQKSSMVSFDFEGKVEVSVTCNREKIKKARIRPLSYNIPFKIKGNTLTFILTNPSNISVEINGDIFHNLQIFTNPLEADRPRPNDPNVIYFGPGFYNLDTLRMESGKNLYLAGGAVLKAKVICDKVHDVKIYGRGILLNGYRGVEIIYSSNIFVNDLIFIDPTHYTIYGGQSDHLYIRNIRSFSSRGWADGIDLMSCRDVLVDGVFMRTSDDCIALYGHRWTYNGDCRNVTVQNATLWADVAHPIMMGTHGNPEPGKSEVLENLTFKNIDILNHDEPQLNYQGCMAINVSDENLARNIHFEDIRVEDFERGQLFNLRVTFNTKYAQAPGRGIENVYFKNVTYRGENANVSILEGYSEERAIKNIVFDNLTINGVTFSSKLKKPGYMKYSDFARIYEGLFVSGVEFLP